MLRTVSCCVAAFAVLLLPGLAAAAAPPPAPCQMPAELVAPAHRLPEIAHALRPGETLDVLALGSGTLLGQRGGMAGSVPEHMIQALRAAVPGVTVHLTLHAARAETAAAMLAAMRRELALHHYQLVLWQTGTVEAVRKLPPEAFRTILGEGDLATAAAGAGLVLIDVPFSRLLVKNADPRPYRAAMEQLAKQSDVELFRRYDLMRYWAASRVIDIEATRAADRDRVAARLRTCLGEALAKLVLAARGP